MKQRISIKELEPNAYQAVFGLEKYLESVSVDMAIRELVKIRTSQINGCAYCIDMHTAQAINNGETPRRIFALSAWWESPLFSEKEKSALALTEEVTRIAEKGLTEATYQRARQYFTENEIAQLIMQTGTINLWNRMAIATHMFHKN